METSEMNYCQSQRILFKNEHNLILSPHPALRSYIANYTFTDPETMEAKTTVLPTVSNTLVYSVGENELISGLRGINTEPTMIGTFAKKFQFLFLVEFKPGGFYPFSKLEQRLLLNSGFAFCELMPEMDRRIWEAYHQAASIEELVVAVDGLFLEQLDEQLINSAVTHAIKRLVAVKGQMSSKALAAEVFYSEKQLNRLFYRQVGTNVKTFAGIVRLKTTLDLLQQAKNLNEMAQQTSHYDAAHYVRDFKRIYQITPQQYLAKMSLFYNDPFKLSSYNDR